MLAVSERGVRPERAERVEGRTPVGGIILGLLGALGQAGGLLLSKQGMAGYGAVPATQMVETRTVTDLLVQAKAPTYLHYMNIDIEGAELEALKGLDFSRYRVGALTIEHNFEEPKRSEIRKLLEQHGYRRVRSVEQDDFYVGPRR